MRVRILDPGAPDTCWPLTATRGLLECWVANRPLREILEERCRNLGLEPVAETGTGPSPILTLAPGAWLSDAALQEAAAAEAGTCWLTADGRPLAWIGAGEQPPAEPVRRVTDPEGLLVRFPWDLLRLNELLVGGLVEDRIEGRVEVNVHWEGRLVLGAGSRLLPGVFIEGNVVIGRNCKIGPNCYLRGNTSIGDSCHIGQAVEIKNSILFPRVSIGHLSYCGDSIIGERVNWGAGTIVANLRHDGKNHRSLVGDTLVDTGRRKFGTVVGDDVHTGIHTSIYPGRKLGPHTSTRPGEVVTRDLR
ncbi:MAG: hypothetical protein Kow00109_23080 [Acidobacteriota bacterium]